MSESLSPGMLRDIDAIGSADAEFQRRYGAEALRRWEDLGATVDADLATVQLALIERRGPEPALREALAWETGLRIDLLQEARALARDEDATTDRETRKR